MKTFTALTIGIVALATASCATAPLQSPTVNVSGEWSGDWVCADPSVGSGIAVLKLSQSGAQVTGSANITASGGGIPRSTDTLRGAVSGDTFILREWTDLNGSFTVTGNRMAGPFQGVLCGGKVALARR
jgi:hypothetical protein